MKVRMPVYDQAELEAGDAEVWVYRHGHLVERHRCLTPGDAHSLLERWQGRDGAGIELVLPGDGSAHLISADIVGADHDDAFPTDWML